MFHKFLLPSWKNPKLQVATTLRLCHWVILEREVEREREFDTMFWRFPWLIPKPLPDLQCRNDCDWMDGIGILRRLPGTQKTRLNTSFAVSVHSRFIGTEESQPGIRGARAGTRWSMTKWSQSEPSSRVLNIRTLLRNGLSKLKSRVVGTMAPRHPSIDHQCWQSGCHLAMLLQIHNDKRSYSLLGRSERNRNNRWVLDWLFVEIFLFFSRNE